MRIVTSDRFFRRNTGGNTTYARHVYAGLVDRGVDHVVHEVPASAVGAAVAEALLPRRATGADIVHYVADTGPLSVTRRRHAPALVTTIQGDASRHVAAVRSPAATRVWRARVAAAARASDLVITGSRSSADDLARHYGVEPRHLAVIPYGIDHDRFTPQPHTEIARVRSTYALPEAFVLYLGNLEPRKNLGPLVEAFASPALSGAHLVIAGRHAWGVDRLVSRLREGEDGNVRWIGPLPDGDVAPVMAAAQLFAFPSLYEGFGFPVLEAMAVGTPVLTSDRGSLAEVTGDTAALLRSLTDPRSIAEDVADLLGDAATRADRRAAGLTWASGFTWPECIDRHHAVLSSLVG